MHTVFKPPGGTLAAADVGAAGRRLSGAQVSGWCDHDWRLVHDEPQDPALHMALDEVLAREAARHPRQGIRKPPA